MEDRFKSLDRVLEQTLDDWKLSKGETAALREILGKLNPSADQRAHYRNHAFDLAAKKIQSAQARGILEWLEKTVKLLWPRSEPAKPSAPDRAYFSPQSDCPGEIVRLFDRARAKADVCVFTITDDRITSAILAAHRRGVALRVITDDEKSHDYGSDVQRLREAGIPVRTDHDESHMHHKFALFDGALLLTGSYNWTRGAANSNKENFLITPDDSLIQSYVGVFEKLWKEFGPR